MTQENEFTYSTEQASSLPSKKIIELGQRLASELGSGQADTASKWLAQNLAEKISGVESGESSVAKTNAEKDAVELIMFLWQRRYSLPEGVGPFSRIEKTLKLIREQNERVNSFFPAVVSDGNPWVRFLAEAESAASSIAKTAAISAFVDEFDGDPLEWEKQNPELFEPFEISALELVDSWLEQIGLGPKISDDGVTSAESLSQKDKMNQAIKQIQVEIDSLQSSLDVLKEQVNQEPENNAPRDENLT